MKIHYFQRYHSKENVDTANTMLLLSRLYSYSPNKFFAFIKENILPDNVDPQIIFNLQEKCRDSVPDATITQPSFKIAVETKLYGQFSHDQLIKHLESFDQEDFKILLTLDPNPMKKDFISEFDDKLSSYNKKHNTHITHRHFTFKELVDGIRSVIDDLDYEMLEVISDYEEYCNQENLIPNAWQRMRVQLAGTTYKSNIALNLYYDNVNRGFSGHEYLGLYAQKSVRAIGKICAIVVAEKINGALVYTTERGDLTDEMKARIQSAIEEGVDFGYDLSHQRYFFVEQFYNTDFKKITPRAPMGSRFFDLTEILSTDKLPAVDKIAELLKAKTWG